MHGLTPSGSSSFADDTTFHTDGVNAVSSMQATVSLQVAGAFLTWMGQVVNMLRIKSKISAIDLGKQWPLIIPVQPPHKALKQLGVCHAV